MTTPDSSVLIAGADPGHPFFDLADRALAEARKSGQLVAHAIAETYATLTGPAFTLPSEAVAAYLAPYLTRPPVGITPDRYPAAIEELAEIGVVGGAVYDALIALGAREAELRVTSLDRRARLTYERCGVDYTLLLDD